MEKMRQWSILTAMGALGLLVVGWFLLVSPQRSHASDLKTQAASQQSANSTLQTQVSQLEAQKKGLPAQQRLLNQIAAKVPASPELPTLIRQLTAAAKSSGVDLQSLAPAAPSVVAAPTSGTTSVTAPASTTGAPAATAPTTSTAGAASPLAQIPVTLSVVGSYANVQSFFREVEHLSRAMLVTDFTLAPGVGTSENAPDGSLLGTVQAVVFESPAVTAVSPTAPSTTATAPAPAS